MGDMAVWQLDKKAYVDICQGLMACVAREIGGRHLNVLACRKITRDGRRSTLRTRFGPKSCIRPH